ncbi:MAG: thiamine pyrophosphate-dependent enzyme [Nitrospirales bacterium]
MHHFLTLYRDMLLIRRFEEKSAEMYALAKIAGFLHLYIGQEAVAVGCMQAIRPDDYVIAAYRDHGHCLAKGSDPKKVMAELFGKATGLCKGKGGSMHLIDAERNFMGGYAIVGGHLPLAVGLAFALRYRKEDRVVLCFFGDGAVPSGQSHEAFNLAALWKLPVDTHGQLLHRQNIHPIHPFGFNPMRVVTRVREDPQPFFIEAATYRFMGHSMSDPAHGHYRTREEVGEARKQDPLILLKTRILDEKLATETDFKQLERDVIETVNECVKFADESPFPEANSLYEDVYVE